VEGEQWDALNLTGKNRDKFSATKAPRQWPFILLAMLCRREGKAFGSGDSIAVRCETIERSWTEFDRKFECWYQPWQGSISWNVDVNVGTTLWRCVDVDIGSTAWEVCSATLKLGTNSSLTVRLKKSILNGKGKARPNNIQKFISYFKQNATCIITTWIG
jgi:hypothetical protein